MSEKVLGFRKKDAHSIAQASRTSSASYAIEEDKLVPVVSVEEHERFKEEANAVILQKNRKIMEWENQQVVSLARLEEYCNNFKGCFDTSGNYHSPNVENLDIKFFCKKLVKDLKEEAGKNV